MSSIPSQKLPDPQLFTVRIWMEPLGHDQIELRGQVRHVLSGETRYFREWPALLKYLASKLDTDSIPESFGEIVE